MGMFNPITRELVEEAIWHVRDGSDTEEHRDLLHEEGYDLDELRHPPAPQPLPSCYVNVRDRLIEEVLANLQGEDTVSDQKPAATETKTQFKMNPDKRTTRFTLPNGIVHDARNIRTPGPIAQACDHALKLTTMERHVLREILDKMGT